MFFKDRLAREGEVLHGVMCVVPSAVSARAIAASGADFLVVDREHGPIGRGAMHAMIAATAGTDCAALVRVPAIDEAEVKAALDAGAEGIVYPLARSAEDVRRYVACLTYPPAGERGWGPFVAHARHGTSLGEYPRVVGPKISCCALIETAEAVDQIDGIVAAEGLDLVVVAVTTVERAARGRVPLGGVALTREQSVALAARGYRVLLNGFDVLMLEERTAAFRDWR